jgi:hypothetical protein
MNNFWSFILGFVFGRVTGGRSLIDYDRIQERHEREMRDFRNSIPQSETELHKLD